MSSAIVNKIQPTNYQELQETLAEVGAKAALRCGLALGSKRFNGEGLMVVTWESSPMLIQQLKIELYNLFGGATSLTFSSVNRPLFSHDSIFFYYLHLLYKMLQAPSPYTVSEVLKE